MSALVSDAGYDPDTATQLFVTQLQWHLAATQLLRNSNN